MRFGMFAVCVSADPDPLLNEGPPTFALYCRLIGFADAGSRDTGRGHPYRSVLASSLSCSKQTVDRATNRLEQEIGLVSVERRKLPGETEENDANRYTLHDSWLINGFPAPVGTPPQLVARYGHTVGGFDSKEWLAEHAPDFDLSAWQAAYDERLAGQLAKEAEQRRKERARRKPKKGQSSDQQEHSPEGGGVKFDATPQDEAPEGGSVKFDATGDVIGDATGGVTNDALLLQPVAPEPSFEMDPGGDGRRPSTGGFASAGASAGAGGEDQPEAGGCAAVIEESAAEVKFDGPVPAGKPAQKRAAAPATKTREPQPVAGDVDVFALLDSLGVLTSPANRIPPLRRAVREFLGAQVDARPTAFSMYPRTAEHAVTRINAGWTRTHTDRSMPGFPGCPQCTESGCTGPQEGCDRIRKPQAYLAQLLLAQDCERPDCERGVILGSRDECGLCIGRAQQMADALAATQWLAEDAEKRARAVAEAEAKRAAQAAREAKRAQAAAEAEARRVAEAEERARLREQLAAEHPELAALAELPEPRGAEGFVRAAGRGRTATEEQRVRSRLVAEGLVGTALDTEVRRRMTVWKADRRREAEAADLAARAASPVGAWPTVSHQQPATAPF
ncbi:hypothetical protein AB0O57_32545 [Streptomyces sp. NPDC091201]|uniref:hypothetical protein n=1 Tax=Streptomyces sp. NPDC091201 TaxID=3155190 RepID=UPI0034482469